MTCTAPCSTDNDEFGAQCLQPPIGSLDNKGQSLVFAQVCGFHQNLTSKMLDQTFFAIELNAYCGSRIQQHLTVVSQGQFASLACCCSEVRIPDVPWQIAVGEPAKHWSCQSECRCTQNLPAISCSTWTIQNGHANCRRNTIHSEFQLLYALPDFLVSCTEAAPSSKLGLLSFAEVRCMPASQPLSGLIENACIDCTHFRHPASHAGIAGSLAPYSG